MPLAYWLTLFLGAFSIGFLMGQVTRDWSTGRSMLAAGAAAGAWILVLDRLWGRV